MTSPSEPPAPPAHPASTPAGTSADDRPVCVLGLGLIGGSVLRAAAASGRAAWGCNRSPEAVRAATADGYDATDDTSAALRRAAEAGALIVIAVPLPAVDDAAALIAEHAPLCPITDVVSVKEPVTAVLSAHGIAERYVGGHPMTGTAESGWAAGSAGMFDSAVWVVAVDDGADPDVWSDVSQLALDCGSVVVPAESGEHDGAVARVSHLPHMLAEALASAGADSQLSLSLAAGSFRDGTRVAATDPPLVRAMCEGNADAVVTALDETLGALTSARHALAAGEGIEAFVGRGHIARREYESVGRSPITGLAPGDPGWVEQMRDAGRAGGVWRGELEAFGEPDSGERNTRTEDRTGAGETGEGDRGDEERPDEPA